ncbi:serine protease 33-like isoform X2 [Rhodnius prolixus]|uniref:serine protease 33-like isoform X2 n=1 Tax=Rhodnius prolixus TaxID=13249 RepID=UPI003D187D38
MFGMQWWCWLLCAVTLCGVAGDNVTTTITSSSSTTTTEGYNETTIITTTFPTTTDMTTLHPEQLPGKPSKFDVDISDKIYVDTKSEDFAILLSNDIKRRPRHRRATIWLTPARPRVHDVRRYVRFPGLPPPPAAPPYHRPWDYGSRSPRLVFRDHQLDAPQLPTVQPSWIHNSVVDDTNQGCGLSVKSQAAQRRIVGGDEAGFGSFPWQAYIRIGSSRCGGSLVNRYHVVTAGHCVARANARQVQVTLGDYVINSAVEPLPAYTYGVRQISVHPYFKFTPQADRFDVAVLRLDRPVQYMPHIAPICLPTKGEDFLGQFGWAAGWGALQPGSRLRPKTLQAVDVPVIDNRLCERWHRSNGINVVIYDEMMCAGYRGGTKDSCQGDSGGPLMLERSGRWYLIGIVSAGYSCAQRGQPGIYHRVAHTVDWISHIINS